MRPNDIETDPAVSIILPRDTTTYITRPRSSSTSTTMSGHSYQSTQSNLSSSSSSRSWYANTDSLAAIPTHLSWLKNTVVELMVDQEGFRTAAAGFKLVGFTNVNGGIAHFLPIKRKAFYTFHHSLLDSDPVLYRIQVNGEEKRDYLTRQATLALKKPGVYTVSGTEALRSSPRVSTPPSEPAPDNFLSMTDATITPTIASGVGCDGKLEWLFTYCVEPCTNARGAVLDGERVLRPVSFACSPMLLHESQARKVGLLRLAAKLVQPKLAAQHIPPPAPPTSLRARAPLRPVDNIPLDVFPQAPLVWNDSHVRAHSQTSAESRTYDDARPLINRDGRLKAASLGEQRPPASQQLVDETTQRLEMLVMPDSQWILPGSPTKSSIAPRAPTAKLDMPSFKDFFEELSAFGFVKHKRTDSNVVPRNR